MYFPLYGGMFTAVDKAIAADRPDVVVADITCIAAIDIAKTLEIPVVVNSPADWSHAEVTVAAVRLVVTLSHTHLCVHTIRCICLLNCCGCGCSCWVVCVAVAAAAATRGQTTESWIPPFFSGLSPAKTFVARVTHFLFPRWLTQSLLVSLTSLNRVRTTVDPRSLAVQLLCCCGQNKIVA